MCKKLSLLILLSLLIPTLAQADEFSIINALEKVPGIKQGAAFDVVENRFSYLSTIEVLKYDNFGFDVGFASDDKLVGNLSYNLGGLKQLGIDTPITNLIDVRVGIYGGWGRLTGSNEWSYGPTVTIISVKF